MKKRNGRAPGRRAPVAAGAPNRTAVKRPRQSRCPELRSSFLSSLLLHSQQIILLVNPAGTILYANHYAEDSTGYTFDELSGKNWLHDLLPEYDQLIGRDVLGSSGKRGKTFLFSSTLVTSTADKLHVQWKAVTYRIKMGERAILLLGNPAQGKGRGRETEIDSRTQVSLPDIMFIINEHGIYVDFRANNPDLLLYRREKIIGARLQNAGFSDEIAEKMLAVIAKVLKSSSMETVEFEMMTSRGLRNVEARILPIAAARVLAIIRDITERKRSAAALRTNEEKFAKAFYRNPSLMILIELESGELVEVNPVFLELTGYRFEEVVGKTAYELGLFKDPGTLTRISDALMKDTSVSNLELLLNTANGDRRDILLSADMLNVEGKQYLLTMGQDITARKAAEQALQESERKFREIADNINEVIWLREGQKILYVSPAVSEVFDVAADEMYNDFRTIIETIHPDDREKVLQSLRDELPSGGGRYVSYRVIRKTGETRWLKTKMFAVNKDGSPKRLAGISEDVTDQVHAENELRQSREQLRALSANLHEIREAERSAVAREIHDDLGQKLTALIMDLSWLKGKLPEDERLRGKAQEMGALVQEIITSVQQISSRLRPSLLDDLGLVSAVEWQVSEFENYSGIACSLSMNFEEVELDEMLATDIFRIVQEGLTNIARHANADSAGVNLRLNEHMLTISIEDNGAGMAESDIMSSKSFGLLGIRERAYNWGGSVSFENGEPSGTVMKVSIPMNNGAEDA